MSAYISVHLRRQVRKLDREQCVYCHSPEALMGVTFEIEHILPLSFGGETKFHNLCLSCPTCNRHKAKRNIALDPQSGEQVRLFHPREQRWNEHFIWSHNGIRVEALSPSGRATIEALHINRLEIIRLRQYWIILNFHPPQDDNVA